MFENLTFESKQAVLDIELVEGESKELVLSFRDDAGGVLLLVGYQVRMDMKVYEQLDGKAIISKTLGNGLAVQANNLTINFFAGEVSNLSLDRYHYDIVFIKGADVRRLVKGSIYISKSITL